MNNNDNELQDFDPIGQGLNIGDLDFMDPASPSIETRYTRPPLCNN